MSATPAVVARPATLKARTEHRLLTHAEEQQLGEKVWGSVRSEATGALLDPGARAAQETLVRRNQRLVVSVALRHRDRGLPIEDLIQEGNLGLLKAVSKYDPALGYRFSTYATWWIRQAITRALDDKSRVVRLPVHFQQKLRTVKRAESDLAQALGRPPAPAEIAEALASKTKESWTPEKVQDTLRSGIEVTSLDREASPRGGSSTAGSGSRTALVDLIEGVDGGTGDRTRPTDLSEGLAKQDLLQTLHDALRNLPHREKTVIEDRYGLSGGPESPLTIVATKLGISPEQVAQLQSRAESLLRKALCAGGPPNPAAPTPSG